MFFTINTSPLKRLPLTNAPTVRELVITTGRKLAPLTKIQAPPARHHGRSANKQQNMNPLAMFFSVGE